jgi:uncharacterized protein YndB with AHSA1/START domain
MTGGRSLSLARVLPAAIEDVFEACTRPELLARWLVCSEDGTASAMNELRVGGRFRVQMRRGDEVIGGAEGRYVEIAPPVRLAFTWSAPNVGVRDSLVTIELRAVGDEETELVLTHALDPATEAGKRHARGWTVSLANLQRLLGGDGLRRVVDLRSEPDRVYAALATLDGLAGWWTPRVSGDATAGGSVRLDFEGVGEQIVLRVAVAERPSRVVWRCDAHTGLPEWNGTTLSFEIAARDGGGSRLRFAHLGLVPALACFENCARGWDHFLASLAGFVDDGRGAPFGDGGDA